MVRFPTKTLIGMVVLYAVASATTIEVPSQYATIQAGIDASSDGDTVLVQPGIYVENIQITERIVVLGSLFLTTGDTAYISTTIIDGDSANSVVRFYRCFDTLSILAGFTIRNGWGYSSGGGIHIDNAHSRIRYNTITDNAAYFAGGGIRIQSNSNPSVYGNVISNNRTTNTAGEDGGGIACYSGNARIRQNVIEENSSHFGGAISLAISSGSPNTIVDSNMIVGNTATHGGGIYVYSGTDTVGLANNLLSGNTANSMGGAVYVGSASPTIVSENAIDGNSAYTKGSGIYCESAFAVFTGNAITNNVQLASSWGGGLALCAGAGALVDGNLFRGNFASYGSAILCEVSNPTIINNTVYQESGLGGDVYVNVSDPMLTNNILWANTPSTDRPLLEVTVVSNPTVTYCNILDSVWTGTGNICSDPMFCDPSNGDYQLAQNSPCLGTGEGGADIGAFGYGCTTVDVDEDDNIPPYSFQLSQNYPNPFNPTTAIEFDLPRRSSVKVAVFNLLGREVSRLVDQELPAGNHRITWDGSTKGGLRASTGVYFYRLEAAGFVETKKMLLLK